MDILRRIDYFKEKKGWTLYRLADEAALNHSTLSNLYARKNEPTLSTLRQICDAFGMTLAEFFDEGKSEFTDDEKMLVYDHRKLDKSQQHLVVEMQRIMIDDKHKQKKEYSEKI